MLRIGKADKYFTLWNVSSSEQFGTDLNGNHYLQYIHTVYDYRQNLSMDESKAIEKAKGFGVTDLEPDEELRGKHSSWKRTQTFDEPKVSNVFSYGRFKGDLIVENEDVNYMNWYYEQDNFVDTESKTTMRKRILVLSDEFCMYEGDLVTVEFKEMRESIVTKKESIRKNGFVDVFVDRNVDGYDKILYAEGINFLFDKVKENYYNGYSYYLPMVDGKAKRIKNKNVRIFVEKEATNDEPFDWYVKSFEVLKK